MRRYAFFLLLLVSLRVGAQHNLRPPYYRITPLNDWKALEPPFCRVFGRDPKTVTAADLRNELATMFGQSKQIPSSHLLQTGYKGFRITSFTVFGETGDSAGREREYLGPIDVVIPQPYGAMACSEDFLSPDVVNLLRHVAATHGKLFLEEIRGLDPQGIKRRLNDIILRLC